MWAPRDFYLSIIYEKSRVWRLFTDFNFFGLILRENGRVRYAGFIIICNVKSPRKLYNIQIVCAFRFIKQNVYQRSEDTRHTNTVYQLYIQRRCRGLLLGSSSLIRISGENLA